MMDLKRLQNNVNVHANKTKESLYENFGVVFQDLGNNYSSFLKFVLFDTLKFCQLRFLKRTAFVDKD